jgi:hypothetical protein
MPSQPVIEEMKFASGSLRNSLSARVFVDLRFKAISSCPVARGFTPTRPATSCDAIPPGGNYASADKISHRHSLPGFAILLPQACHCIKSQSLHFGIVFNAATQPWLQLIHTADARHQ